MNTWPQVDFKKLVQEVSQLQAGKDHLTILGGICAENALSAFLQQMGPDPDVVPHLGICQRNRL